jgi:threonine/homoserine/homoserine lactone efflux protein
VIHTLLAAAGLSALIAASALAFGVVKACGAAYLLYLGARLIVSSFGRRMDVEPAELLPPATPAAVVREALVINVFNPKVALFFLAFLPQFVDAAAPSPALAFVLLGCLFNANSLLINLPVAWLAARAGRRLRASVRLARWLSGALGTFFVLLAARLATLQRQ